MLLRWRLFWERTKRLRRIIGNCTITVNDFSDRNQEGTGTLCLGGLGTLSETIEGVSIGADVEYLDLRADNGVFDIKSIAIVPAKN